MFGELDFIYLPSRDVAADLAYYVDGLAGELVFAIERFDTRVAMVRAAEGGPHLVLAEHLAGDQPVCMFRVADLAAEVERLAGRGLAVGEPFEFPFGDAVEVRLPGPQRIAVYQRTQAERGASLTGRFDFTPRSTLDDSAGR